MVPSRRMPPSQQPPGGKDRPMKLLHIDSSILGGQSASRALGAAVVAARKAAEPGIEVTYRDLAASPLPHLSGGSLAKADPAEAAAAEQVLQEFLDADVVVIGAPMYNFAIPSTLKAWIDRLAVAGRTFRYNEQGMAEGLAGGKQVVVASSRGGFHQASGMDFQEPYLRQILGFMGIDDVTFVRAEGLAVSPAQREASMQEALAAIAAPLPIAA
jgi:FMN-dependent NADH-azoreductase